MRNALFFFLLLTQLFSFGQTPLKTDTTILTDSIQQLREVTVNGRKLIYERKIDRLVFNVQNSPALVGQDLIRALETTPMIQVNDRGISISGKSSVAVMINDRLLQLSGTELINYLRSLRAENIERIEVITTPPAKYDAEGNSGLINIVLKRNPDTGWSGSVSSSYTQRKWASVNNSATINYQFSRFTASIKPRQYNIKVHSNEDLKVVAVPLTTAQHDDRKDLTDGAGVNVSMEYQLSKYSNLGLIYDVGGGHANKDVQNQFRFIRDEILDSLSFTQSKQRSKRNFQVANLYYDVKFDSLGRKLSINCNYMQLSPLTNTDFNTLNLANVHTDTVLLTSDVRYKIFSGQADLILPYKFVVIETGLKYSQISNKSDIGYLNKWSGSYLKDPAKSNLFDYKEKNYAGYISLRKDFSKKISAKAGVRYEYSSIKGISVSSEQVTTYDYGRWFPTMYFTYTPNTNNTLSVNYSSRISRPSFRSINPFRWYSNPYSYSTGNPFLQPSYNHNLELAYIYQGNFSVSLYAQKVINGFNQVLTIVDDIQVSTFVNYLTQHNYGLNVNYSFDHFSWWQSALFANGYYMKAESFVPEFIGQHGFSMYYQTNNTFFLDKKKNFMALVNFRQYLPSRNGNDYGYGYTNLGAGVSFSVLNRSLQITCMADDILRKNKSRGKIFYSRFTEFYNNYYDARLVSLGASFKFGNKKVKGKSKKIDFEESKRAN
jgi:hypothetical protein